MDEPRPKWRISIRAAIGGTMGLCVGMALIRATAIDDGFGVFVGLCVIAGTLGAVVAIVSGRSAVHGAGWGIIALIAAAYGCLVLLLFVLFTMLTLRVF